MASSPYSGIRFPDRAEFLSDFAGYKVFLEPWAALADDLQVMYEGLSLRRDTRLLAVHGAQGTGKTMFATQLQRDFLTSKDAGSGDEPNKNNLWHRITGGRDLSRDAIVEANLRSDVLLIEDEQNWVASTAEWLRHRTDRRCLVIADNAERSYFRQGLVNVDDADYVRLASNPALVTMAAQRLVALCRGQLRGALFLILSNDDTFLLELDEAVQAQHSSLLTLTQLPVPDRAAKELVVRVNTNRLNNVSYWYCIDKAGPTQKIAVKAALEGAANYPDSFAAVDNGLRTADPSRTGRPAKQNVIDLIVCTSQADVTSIDPNAFGNLLRTEVSQGWLACHVYGSGWAPQQIGSREAALLESEWMLRIVFLGSSFVDSLLLVETNAPPAPAHLKATRDLLKDLETFHGPGTQAATRVTFTQTLANHVINWPADASPTSPSFWAMGQTRSTIYESALRKVLPTYNASAPGFLSYRPDFVVSPFRPCSIVSAISNSVAAVNSAIRREGHVFEFTAIDTFSPQKVSSYLIRKLPNYVEVTQEQ